MASFTVGFHPHGARLEVMADHYRDVFPGEGYLTISTSGGEVTFHRLTPEQIAKVAEMVHEAGRLLAAKLRDRSSTPAGPYFGGA